MQTVTLGFKAFDIHELLCHAVAQQSGLYQQWGLNVNLLDTTFVGPDQLPENFFSAACGAALVGWLQGEANKVLLVNTDRPMFWFYQRENHSELSELQGKTIASYPDIAPPAQFLRKILTDQQVNASIQPCATDVARLGLLKTGQVDAAVISSAIPPAQMAQYGFEQPLQLGQMLRIPTTGLAIHSVLQEQSPDLVTAMVDCHQKALNLIHEDDALLSQVLQAQFSLADTIVDDILTMIRHCYTQDGQTTDAIIESAINNMARQLGKDIPPTPLYDFSLLK